MRLAVLTLVCALACGSEGDVTVRIDLRTDYVAGVEFDRATASWDGVVYDRAFDVDDRDEVDHRITSLEASRGMYPLRVELSRPDGTRLAQRTVNVEVRGSDVGVTVLITRTCGEVACGADENCLGGRCVPSDCVRGDEPSCPDPVCTGADECTDFVAACVNPTCELGSCVYRGECAGADYCDPVDGCVPLVSTDAGMDAGMDAGFDAAFDGGPPIDVGTDAGPPPCNPWVDPGCPDCTDDATWPWKADEQAFLDRLNELRAEGGVCDGVPYMDLPPLRMNSILQEAARCHSVWMAENDMFDIDGPGGTAGDNAEDDGYPGSTRSGVTTTFASARAAEILVGNDTFCDLPTNAFTHPAIGVGTVDHTDNGTFTTRVFGTD